MKKIEKIKETINVKELFEKYRHNIVSGNLYGWGEFPEEGFGSFKEYMEEEGYGAGVVLFLDRSIEKITNGEFKVIHWDNYIDENYDDKTIEEVVYKRKDGKLFKCYFCIEDGNFDEELIEVQKKKVSKTIYE